MPPQWALLPANIILLSDPALQSFMEMLMAFDTADDLWHQIPDSLHVLRLAQHPCSRLPPLLSCLVGGAGQWCLLNQLPHP